MWPTCLYLTFHFLHFAVLQFSLCKIYICALFLVIFKAIILHNFQNISIDNYNFWNWFRIHWLTLLQREQKLIYHRLQRYMCDVLQLAPYEHVCLLESIYLKNYCPDLIIWIYCKRWDEPVAWSSMKRNWIEIWIL